MPTTAAPPLRIPDAALPGFDDVTTAFDRFAAGDDEGALAALGAIGLASPLAPWKLLLRGLIAWHAGDNSRALDNWQRLPADSTPARLITPLRAEIDPPYSKTLNAATRKRLPHWHKALVGGGLAASLKKLHEQSGDRLAHEIFDRARTLLAPLARMMHDGPARLTAAMSLLFVNDGEATDLRTLATAFPAPPDDPKLDRLRALYEEDEEDLDRAARAWRDYEETLAAHPAIFGPDTDRARAHVWNRIAELERDLLMERGSKKAKREQPDPLASIRRSLELAPDFLPALRAKLLVAIARTNEPAVLEAGRELLRHHPGDTETLVALANFFRVQGDWNLALKYARQLCEHAPLELNYRVMHALHLRVVTRRQLRDGDASALAQLNRVVELHPLTAASIAAIRTAYALRGGDEATAEAQIAQAPGHPAGFAVRMLGEAAFFGVPELTKRFLPVLRKALAAAATVPTSLAVTEAFAGNRHDEIKFPKQYELERRAAKKWATAVRKAKEADAVQLVKAARLAGWDTDLVLAFSHLSDRFPHNAQIPFEIAVALFSKGPKFLESAVNYARVAAARLRDLPPDRRPPGLEEELQQVFGPMLAAPDFFDVFNDIFGGFVDD